MIQTDKQTKRQLTERVHQADRWADYLPRRMNTLLPEWSLRVINDNINEYVRVDLANKVASTASKICLNKLTGAKIPCHANICTVYPYTSQHRLLIHSKHSVN